LSNLAASSAGGGSAIGSTGTAGGGGIVGRTDDDACSGGGDAFDTLFGGGASVGAIVAALAEIVCTEATAECAAVVIAFIHERAVPAVTAIKRADTASAFAIKAASAGIISPRATACLVSSMA
jgi:hypothetical protein